MPVHLPDPGDKAMTIHATDGPKESTTRISYTPHHGVTARCDIQATPEPVCFRVRGLVVPAHMRNCVYGPGRRGCWFCDSIFKELKKHAFAPSRRIAPELLQKISRPIEGAGNAGCPMHPQPL